MSENQVHDQAVQNTTRLVNTTLLKGDCLQLLQAIPSGTVGYILTDPPYSSGGLHASDRAHSPTKKYQQTDTVRQYPEFDGDSRDQRSWMLWCQLWLSECYRVAKPGAPIALFCDWRQLPATTDVMQLAGFVWRGIAVWDKGGGCRPTMGRFANQAEYLVWGSKGPMPRNRNAPCLPGVFKHSVRMNDKFHVTGKPTALMSELVRLGEPGEIILDPFMGSGTTGVSCVKEGYDFIGMDQETSYFDIASRRIQEAKDGIDSCASDCLADALG